MNAKLRVSRCVRISFAVVYYVVRGPKRYGGRAVMFSIFIFFAFSNTVRPLSKTARASNLGIRHKARTLA